MASKGIKDFDGHYYFNREYWYQRVRMTAREPDDASAKLLLVLGQHDLLRLEGDNATGDSAQQLSASPSLLRGVVLYHDDSSLPRFVFAFCLGTSKQKGQEVK